MFELSLAPVVINLCRGLDFYLPKISWTGHNKVLATKANLNFGDKIVLAHPTKNLLGPQTLVFQLSSKTFHKNPIGAPSLRLQLFLVLFG